MDEDFVTWLNNEMNKRGWSNSELHRRSGLANSTISMVLGGHKNPGWDFCAAIAEAMGESPDRVFRLAGLLPRLPASESPTLDELQDVVKAMPPEKQKEVLRYARYLRQNDD